MIFDMLFLARMSNNMFFLVMSISSTISLAAPCPSQGSAELLSSLEMLSPVPDSTETQRKPSQAQFGYDGLRARCCWDARPALMVSAADAIPQFSPPEKIGNHLSLTTKLVDLHVAKAGNVHCVVATDIGPQHA